MADPVVTIFAAAAAKAKLRSLAIVDVDEAARRIGACECPALIIGGEILVVEHWHRHGCPELRRAS